MRTLLLVGWQDLGAHLRKPSFWVATLILPLLPALFFWLVGRDSALPSDLPLNLPAPGVVAAPPPDEPLGLVDQSGLMPHLPPQVPAGALRLYPDEASGAAALARDEVRALFVLPADYAASGQVIAYVPTGQRAAASGGLDLLALAIRASLLAEADPGLAARMASPLHLRAYALSPTVRVRAADGQSLQWLGPLVFAMVFSLASFAASSVMLQSVVEEKESRMIEVLLSSISPRQLLLGKVLGLGLLGLLQLLIWMGMSALLIGQGLVALLGEVRLPPALWVLALVYFVLSYLIYALVLAAVGALSASLRETSQLAMLLTVPTLAPVLLLPTVVTQPHSPLAVAGSLVPLTSPVVMLMRQSIAVVPGWQVALSLALLAVALAATAWAAGRLFRASTLLAGKTFSLREIARALVH